MDEPFDLARFVDAQAPVYERVVAELQAGRKKSHWMWFVFPQVAGLGQSSMARRFSLSSLAEARAYLKHPLLGPRLRQCTELMMAIEGRPVRQILGTPDDLKFRSSMTLFFHASDDGALFSAALEKYCDGEEDPLTVDRIARGTSS